MEIEQTARVIRFTIKISAILINKFLVFMFISLFSRIIIETHENVQKKASSKVMHGKYTTNKQLKLGVELLCGPGKLRC